MQDQSTALTAPKAAIYCRVSTDQQERDGSSLDTQQEKCIAYAERKGYHLAPEHIYRDSASGATLERAALNTLLEAARARAFDIVIVKDVSRLSRDQVDVLTMRARLKAHNVTTEFVDRNYGDTALDTFMLSAEAFGAEHWREQHTARVIDGRLARAKSQMLLPGRKPAYGYCWRDPQRGETKSHYAYDRDPLTAPIIERIFTTLANGGSMTQLKREFEAEGIPGPLGGANWSLGTLGRLVRDPKYKGEAEMRRTRTNRRAKQGPQTTLLPEDERVKLPADVVPALVSTELWERANVHLAHSGWHNRRREPEPERYLLRGGFVVCAHCGRTLGTRHYRHTHRYRIQPTHARAHGCSDISIDSGTLDTAVWELIEQIIQHPDRILDKIVADFTSEADPTQEERGAVEKVLKEVERERKMQTLIVGTFDDPEVAAPNIARLKQLGQDAKRLQVQLAELDQRRAGWASGLAAASRLTEQFQHEQARLDNLSYDEKRAILSRLGVTVKLWPSGASPRWELTTKLKLPVWPWTEPGPDEPDLDTVPVPASAQYAGSEHFFDDADHPRFREILEGLTCQSTSSLRYPSPK